MNDSVDKKREILYKMLKEPHSVLVKAEAELEDFKETNSIEEIVRKKFNFYETELEAKHKEEVLGKLDSIIKRWSFKIAKEIFPENIASKMGAKLYTFGSYRLNVNTNDADIDTVCVVPNFINREEHFFVELYELLKGTQKVTEINCIKNAAVPILKMIFDSIHIDMSYAQLDMQRIDDSLNLNDNNLLMNLDEKSCKSLNGRRVADMILKSVPNEDTFRATLRCIKLWAKNKGIHSNVMGYLGGVSWAILVAKICQMFPNYQPNKLIEKFFHYYESWDWERIPVKIEHILEEKHNPKHLEQWTEAQMDKNLMSIITPAFPCMNSSHAVTQASLNILKNLLKEGHQIIKEIKQKKKTWVDLFEKLDFFNLYKTFIEIDVVGNNKEEFGLWLGFIESKIRKMTNNFEWQKLDEMRSYVDVLDFHLYPRCFPKNDKDFSFAASYFYGLKLKPEFAQEFQGFKFEYFSVPMSRFSNHIFEEAFKEDKGGFKSGAKINLRVYKIKHSELMENGGPEALAAKNEELKAIPKDNSQINNNFILGKRPLPSFDKESFNKLNKKIFIQGEDRPEGIVRNNGFGGRDEKKEETSEKYNYLDSLFE